MITPEDLKKNKISKTQQKFAMQYVLNGENGSSAYRSAYKADEMKASSVWVEASRLLKNPKVALWIEYYRQNQKETILDEFKYTQAQAFNEIDEMLIIALKELGKNNTPNLSAATKLLDMKNRLAGNYEKDNQQKALQVTTMGSVLVDGLPVLPEVGTDIEE